MKILSTKQFDQAQIIQQLRQKRSKAADVQKSVADILARVQKEGDKALLELTKRFDGATLASLAVSRNEIKKAYRSLAPKALKALRKAKCNIEKFHKAILRKREKCVETEKGVEAWREFRPIDKVGLYVPGGKAAYPSTVLMLGVPARVAGCQEIILCTPVSKEGKIKPAVLVAADLCGITKIFKVGGAQAIAGMAYGTETVPKVSKIFGPGNQYVTAAKMLVYGEVAIDMPAGPSEAAVLTDASANPKWIAADLLSQLEHGEDSQAVLVAFKEQFAKIVIKEMKRQILRLSRKEIIQKSFEKSFAIIVRSINEACAILNEYAPEHLEIVMQNESEVLRKINNVGSVFLGKFASEPLGDYATGANHTLPTSGFAKMFPPLSAESFGKMIQIQKVSKQGIANLRKTVETLAAIEGFDAHKNAVTIRFL